jgi:hypothetical protein
MAAAKQAGLTLHRAGTRHLQSIGVLMVLVWSAALASPRAPLTVSPDWTDVAAVS